MSTVNITGVDKPTSTVAIIDAATGLLGTIPIDLLTDGGDGPNRRLRVDVGQTGFFAGREFRTFVEYYNTAGTQIPTGQRILYRAVTTVNVILMSLEFAGDNGQIRVTTYRGGTPTGTFSNSLTAFPANGMTTAPAYTVTSVLTYTAPGASGAVNITGGTQLDVIRLKIENATGSASSVGAQVDSERGLSPNTYYILVENIGTGIFEGTFKMRFEERP